jgi:hypothetical protein
MTWSTWDGSIFAWQAPAAGHYTSVMSSPISRLSILSMAVTTSFTSRTWATMGYLRANPSS